MNSILVFVSAAAAFVRTCLLAVSLIVSSDRSGVVLPAMMLAMGSMELAAAAAGCERSVWRMLVLQVPIGSTGGEGMSGMVMIVGAWMCGIIAAASVSISAFRRPRDALGEMYILLLSEIGVHEEPSERGPDDAVVEI